jgi:hypothetical protein
VFRDLIKIKTEIGMKRIIMIAAATFMAMVLGACGQKEPKPPEVTTPDATMDQSQAPMPAADPKADEEQPPAPAAVEPTQTDAQAKADVVTDPNATEDDDEDDDDDDDDDSES